jgi:hypothetical protein
VVMAMLSCVCGIDSCRRVVVVSAAAGPAVAGRSGLHGGEATTSGFGVEQGSNGSAATVQGADRRWCASSSCWAEVLKSAGKQRWVSSWRVGVVR